jgi:hypothetical protein
MKQPFVRFGGMLLLATALAACSGMSQAVPTGPAQSPAQSSSKTQAVRPMVLNVDKSDRMIAATYVAGQPHIMPVRFKNPYAKVHAHSAVGYPLDMTCQTKKCPVMPSSTAYNVYVTPDGKTCATESCWGDPEEFLQALTGSPLAGVAQQYTGGDANAYTYGGSVAVKYKLAYSNTFYNNDLFTILVAAVKHFKAVGLTSQYHLFLPPGIDTCFDQYGICYSPDNLNSFYFCAYHSAVYAGKDSAGHPIYITYSVEPYQNAKVKINGKKYYACQDQVEPTGVNRLNSGTASTLSHESFEAWSDPLPNTGWFNSSYGMEIGDVCAYSFMANESMGGKSWYVQQEYSNTYHGCADTP